MGTERVVALDVEAVRSTVWVVSALYQLLKYANIVLIVLLRLPFLNVTQKFFLLL